MWLPSSPTSGAVLRFLPGVLVLVVTSALVIRHGFDGLYGQDAFGYVNYALGPVREALLHLEGPPAWPQPPGYPMRRRGGLADRRAGRSHRAGREPAGRGQRPCPRRAPRRRGRRPAARRRAAIAVPLLAGLLAALPGQLWQSSAVAMADTLAIALATAGAWGACRYARSGRLGWLLAAAATTAFAIDTRWIYGLVAVPIAIVGLIGVWRIMRLDRRRAVIHALAATLVGAAVLAPVMLPMGLAILDGTTVPFAADFGAYRLGSTQRAAQQLRDDRRAPRLRPGERRVLPAPAGHAVLVRASSACSRCGAPRGSSAAARRSARRSSSAGRSIVLVFLVGSPYQNPRFFLAAMPPVAILSCGRDVAARDRGSMPGSPWTAGAPASSRARRWRPSGWSWPSGLPRATPTRSSIARRAISPRPAVSRR